jgi:hypothetical protein
MGSRYPARDEQCWLAGQSDVHRRDRAASGCGVVAAIERVLDPLHGARSGGGNRLFVRDAGRLAERVR